MVVVLKFAIRASTSNQTEIAPFGGYKMSAYEREQGAEALESILSTKLFG